MQPQTTILDPDWIDALYGIPWDGAFEFLAGKIATVLKISNRETGQPLVIRISNPEKIDAPRLERIHKFQNHLTDRGVYTVVPLKTQEGRTLAFHRELNRIVEIFPFIEGRHPARGSLTDAKVVANALAEFHNTGIEYQDLPGEESLDQNHVALQRLKKSVQDILEASAGASYKDLLLEYVQNVDTYVLALETLRPHLTETGLHLDAGPNNIILGNDGKIWFIDCSHILRGRRVFEVVVSAYYMDKSSVAPPGDPLRYELLNPNLASTFFETYKAACWPQWTDAENQAISLERKLMLIHGVTCWHSMYPEDIFVEELRRFEQYRDHILNINT